MSLVKMFYELNQVAKEIEDAIYKINVDYLNSDYGYPYKDVNALTSGYRSMYDKVYKKKNSSFNDFLNNFSAKRKALNEKLSAPSVFTILANASEKTVPHILEGVNNYIPTDEESEKKIDGKLFPVVKDLELGTITSLYSKFKENLSSDASLESAIYLQKMFVGYTNARLVHNSVDRGIRSRHLWTYDEVCESFLKEPALINEDKDNGKSR